MTSQGTSGTTVGRTAAAAAVEKGGVGSMRDGSWEGSGWRRLAWRTMKGHKWKQRTHVTGAARRLIIMHSEKYRRSERQLKE